MSIKLIAIDLDGTLLNAHHLITPAVELAVKMAKAQGVKIVLTTGRPLSGVTPYLEQLDLYDQDDYCITHNGAMARRTSDGQIVIEELLNFTDYCYLESLSRHLGVHFHALDANAIYTTNPDISRYTVRESFLTNTPLFYKSLNDMDPKLFFPKVMMVDEPEILAKGIAQLPEDIYQRFTCLMSSPYFFEILSPQADKGKTVQRLAQYLGINRQNVMAIGDNGNDLAMLSYAGIAVAMGNALPEIKDIAHYVTHSNLQDGVAHAIDKFVLQV